MSANYCEARQGGLKGKTAKDKGWSPTLPCQTLPSHAAMHYLLAGYGAGGVPLRVITLIRTRRGRERRRLCGSLHTRVSGFPRNVNAHLG